MISGRDKAFTHMSKQLFLKEKGKSKKEEQDCEFCPIKHRTIYPEEFVADKQGTQYYLSSTDPIFGVKEPNLNRIPTEKCNYCGHNFEEAKKKKKRFFCDWCGVNMCESCTRERFFEGQNDTGPILGKKCLICLKKEFVDAIV